MHKEFNRGNFKLFFLIFLFKITFIHILYPGTPYGETGGSSGYTKQHAHVYTHLHLPSVTRMVCVQLLSPLVSHINIHITNFGTFLPGLEAALIFFSLFKAARYGSNQIVR